MHLPALFSKNLPLKVYLLILIVLYLLHKHGLVNSLIFQCFKVCPSYEKLNDNNRLPQIDF